MRVNSVLCTVCKKLSPMLLRIEDSIVYPECEREEENGNDRREEYLLK